MRQMQDIETPNYRIDTSNVQILSKPIDPIKLLRLVEDEEYEEIIHEWVYEYLQKKYQKVCWLGGTGDKGRDIAAYDDYKKSIWDNYQCKHYSRKLNPSDILREIGKLCYYCYIKELIPPKAYYFVSPQGVGTQVHDMLKNPDVLKKALATTWDRNCRNKILTNKKILLDVGLIKYINSFDFSIFDYIEPLKFIEQYKETCYFASRFGGFKKIRPLPQPAPNEIQEIESIYIKNILAAYSEYLKADIDNAKKLDSYPDIKKDFERHRTCFFCAESLKEFSRDNYDPDLQYFDKLKSEIYDGIIETVEEDAENGFVRLKKVLKRATEIVISNNPLIADVKVNDRKGICHHLSNERSDIKWKR